MWQHICSVFLNGFDPDLCARLTAPGVTTLEYAPLPSVDVPSYEIALLNGNQQKAIVAEWHRLPFVSGSGRYSAQSKRDEQAPTWDLQLSATLPGDVVADRAELDAMTRFRFLVRLRHLGSTAYTLLGTLEQPLEFTHGYDSGADAGDGRQYSAQFKGVSLVLPPGYTSVF